MWDVGVANKNVGWQENLSPRGDYEIVDHLRYFSALFTNKRNLFFFIVK